MPNNDACEECATCGLSCCVCITVLLIVFGSIAGGIVMIIFGSQGIHDNSANFAGNVCLIIFGVLIVLCCCFGGGKYGHSRQTSSGSASSV